MPADFTAEIYLWPPEAGGRNGALAGSVWNTVLGVDGEHWSVRVIFSGAHLPGETFHAQVYLLFPEAAEHFPVGARFTVWEGGTKGTGRVLSSAA